VSADDTSHTPRLNLLSRFRNFLGRHHNIRAHFWQSLANYTQSGGGMLLGIVLARLLEPSVFGEFVTINATLAFLMIPASFSTGQLLVSDGGKTVDLFERVLGMALTVSLVKFLILAVFITYSLAVHNHQTAIIAGIAGIPMVLTDWINALKSDLEGRGFFKPNFFVQIADLTANAAVTIILVMKGWGVYGLAMGGLAGFIPQALLYIRLSDRRLVSMKFGPSEFIRQFRSGFWLWLGSVSSNWYFRIDKILLGHFGGPTQLGYYNRAMNYGPISHILLNSFMTNATIRGLSKKETPREKAALFYKTAGLVITAGFVNGMIWYFMAPFLVPWIFGNNWIGAVPAFQILGWMGVPYFFVYGSATILYAENKFQTVALVHSVGIITLFTSIIFAGYNNFLEARSTSLILISCIFFTGILMSFFSIRSLLKPRLQSAKAVL
jgi:O-antigen/teichoic acid export membrane protein